jgi:hypothetical protein
VQAAECESWVCRRMGSVDIAPVLAVLDRLPFAPVNVGSTNPARSPCQVVPLGVGLPAAVSRLVSDLHLGGETKRLLVRKLGPRQGMPRHVDAWMPDESDWRRFQVPLTSHPDIKMCWPEDGQEVHLEPGSFYEVRFDRMHEVVNPTDCSRIHLQIDQVGATI